MQDITERKKAEQEREKLIQELDAFAHTVAHDLRDPVGLIVGFAELEQCYTLASSDEMQQSLRLIARIGRKMNNIIDELLLLAGVRQTEVEMKPLDMVSIVAEAQQRVADMIHKYRAKVVSLNTWPEAMGHAPWVEEMWVNYLSNALKYGGRPPCLELGATVQPDGLVRFWVRDNGPGLTPEEQARMFVPFTRPGQAHATGHGLGLSIVRRIAEKLNGQVGVESDGVPGQGSVFYFSLPVSKAPAA
jgi:signal transduction histidine kinase